MEADERGWGRAGEAVEARRGVKRWTQQQAAEAAHVDVSTWQEIEAGRGHASRWNTLAAVADALGWQPDQIQRIAAGEDPPWRAEGDRMAAIEDAVTELRDLFGLLTARLDRLDPPRDG